MIGASGSFYNTSGCVSDSFSTIGAATGSSLTIGGSGCSF